MQHWNRSAGQLGSKALEGLVAADLTRVFPVDKFLVDIDVVGNQVQVRDYGGIEIYEKALPVENFGFNKRAAVVATAEKVISSLMEAGQLSRPIKPWVLRESSPGAA